MNSNYDQNSILPLERVSGDDYTPEMILKWYEEESTAYESEANPTSEYSYYALNDCCGYKTISKSTLALNNILSFGGAMGWEVEPVIDKTNNVYIIEPSKKLRREKILDKKITYINPNPEGNIQFEDGYFDLITCFGVLMYIPNVSHVLEEFYRCLSPGGYLLIREPITSIGSGKPHRKGCGTNARGIPLQYFRKWISEKKFPFVKETPCMFSPLRKIMDYLPVKIYNNHLFTLIDIFLSRLFLFNYKYYRQNKLDKYAPGSVFLILKK